MKKNPKLLWIIGFLMVGAGIYLLVSVITPSHYKRTSGVIMSESTATGYKREISFTGEDGKLYMGVDRSYSSDRQGSGVITVAYDPNNPEKTMRVVSDDRGTVLWGSIIALLGAGLVYLGFYKPRPEQYAPLPGTGAGASGSDDSGTSSAPTRKMHTKKPKK